MNQELLYKYFKGITSVEEEKMILDWIDASDENRNIFLKERMIYDISLFSDKQGNSLFKTAKSKIPVTNATETENRFLLEKERIEIQKRINLYMLDLENRLKAYQEVDFSAFFYEVLKKENGNIRICVKLAHKTMSKYYRDINSFGISISTEIVGIPEYPMIKIWKTIIYKKM